MSRPATVSFRESFRFWQQLGFISKWGVIPVIMVSAGARRLLRWLSLA